MNIEERIKMCLIIEKMYKNKEYSKKLGLLDISEIHGKRINQEEAERNC